MLSEARSNAIAKSNSGELSSSEVEGFQVWEVFTQKKDGDIHLHTGSLSAPDVALAKMFAREHYGQDQICVSLWVGERDSFKSLGGDKETYEVFVQKDAGSRHEHAGNVDAINGKDAREKCKEQFIKDNAFCTIWACPLSKLSKIESSIDMIWRETTDQSYRLAKGYSKVVRQKWEALRATKAVDKYQSEDLEDTF
jgi:1,2-phenylacetyl-CoA epoxidase PaaB subunit